MFYVILPINLFRSSEFLVVQKALASRFSYFVQNEQEG